MVQTIAQDLILLKIDFKKAYDIVSFPFLFKALRKLGLLENFVRMAQVLFVKAEVSVCLYKVDIGMIATEQGVRQGCPMAPYLFLVVGQALNATTKFQLQLSSLHGIRLPNHPR